jgi:hypothetical protein
MSLNPLVRDKLLRELLEEKLDAPELENTRDEIEPVSIQTLDEIFPALDPIDEAQLFEPLNKLVECKIKMTVSNDVLSHPKLLYIHCMGLFFSATLQAQEQLEIFNSAYTKPILAKIGKGNLLQSTLTWDASGQQTFQEYIQHLGLIQKSYTYIDAITTTNQIATVLALKNNKAFQLLEDQLRHWSEKWKFMPKIGRAGESMLYYLTIKQEIVGWLIALKRISLILPTDISVGRYGIIAPENFDKNFSYFLTQLTDHSWQSSLSNFIHYTIPYYPIIQLVELFHTIIITIQQWIIRGDVSCLLPCIGDSPLDGLRVILFEIQAQCGLISSLNLLNNNQSSPARLKSTLLFLEALSLLENFAEKFKATVASIIPNVPEMRNELLQSLTCAYLFFDKLTSEKFNKLLEKCNKGLTVSVALNELGYISPIEIKKTLSRITN